MWADTLQALERAHLLRLIVWGAASILAGTAILAWLRAGARESALLRHFAIQTAAWGTVDAAIALSPTPYAFLNRGLAHRAPGNLAEAKADLEVWVRVDPGWAPAVAAIDAALEAQNSP